METPFGLSRRDTLMKRTFFSSPWSKLLQRRDRACQLGRAKLVFSYSHEDEAWKNLLEKHLNVLAKQNIIEIWTDRQIGPGHPWRKAILRAIDSADVVILVISVDFLISDFILNVEVPRILKRHQNKKLALVPVLVRPCAWEAVDWLRKIQIRPWNGISLSLLPSERGEVEIAELTREVMHIAMQE